MISPNMRSSYLFLPFAWVLYWPLGALLTVWVISRHWEGFDGIIARVEARRIEKEIEQKWKEQK